MADMADEYGHLPRGPRRLLAATRWSWQGMRSAWLHESSFRLEVVLFVSTAPLAWLLGSSPLERALLLGSGLLVLAMELMNSAIEAVIERYGAEQHPLAGRAKDMGSAAVCLLVVNASLMWTVLVIVPAISGR